MQRPATPDVVLPSNYRMICEIGRGGMATVYLAHDGRHERPVAVKVLRPDVSAVVTGDRFLREIRVAAGLQHPYVVPVFDSGEATNGAGQPLLWYAMPYIEGETLAERIRRDPPLTVDDTLHILRCVADALAHAHERRVVHRDVKPENILLSGSHAVVADFGIAKAMSGGPESITGTGLIVGTPAYMAPEQATGDPAADHRADIYALGCVAYEMLTGSELFPGLPRQELLQAHVTRQPPSLASLRPDLAAGVVAVVERCLRKKADERWQTASALREALSALLRGTAVLAIPSSEDWRGASARGDWSTALDALRAVDAAGNAGAEELEALAEAEWWKGHGAESLAARERAYAAFVAAGDARRAARTATRIAEEWFDRRSRAVGHGWLQHAERHLAECGDECAEHGWLLRLRVRLALDADNSPAEAVDLARQAVAIARRTGDRALEAISIQDEGRALIALGRTAAGLPLIDEAMATVMTGQLDLETTGRAYCNMMGVCELLADYSRAREWTAASARWAEPHGESAFPGICRVRRAGLLRLEGEWAEAENEARRAGEDLREMLPQAAGAAYYELGEIRMRRGDLDGAAEMFAAAHELGHAPVPGLALLRLSEGRVDAAATLIARALDDSSGMPLVRARLLPPQVEIAIAKSDVALAAHAASELASIAAEHPSDALRAAAAEAEGRVRLAQGKVEDALPRLAEARRLWQQVEMPYEIARVRSLLAQAYAALGDDEHASLETAAARSGRERLGI